MFGKKIRPVSQQSQLSGLSICLGRTSSELENYMGSDDVEAGKTATAGCVEVEEGEYDRRDSVWEDIN